MRVLVTYGWCRTAYVICESLARAGFRVSACGDSRLSMTRASRYVETFDRTPNPFEEPRRYAAEVGTIARRRGVSVIVPGHEDFMALQEFRGELPEAVLLAAPERGQAAGVLDKWELTKRAAAAGIRVPKTQAPASMREAEEAMKGMPMPAVVKPRFGNGGKGVVAVTSALEGVAAYRRLVARFGLEAPQLPLIQEQITGSLMGSCFIAVRGEVRGCFVERYLRSKQSGFGTSVYREPAANDGIRTATDRLCRELQWTGVGHLDFIEAGDGTAYLIEMNPRFWGALDLAVRNGFDFPLALVQLAVRGSIGEECFRARPRVESLWIAGEWMACLDDIRQGRWMEAMRSPARIVRAGHYDDFRLRDPLPLALELAYYLNGFVRSGGDVNPARVGMFKGKQETVCDPASN